MLFLSDELEDAWPNFKCSDVLLEACLSKRFSETSQLWQQEIYLKMCPGGRENNQVYLFFHVLRLSYSMFNT